MHNDIQQDAPVLDTRIPVGHAVAGLQYGRHVNGHGWSGYFVKVTSQGRFLHIAQQAVMRGFEEQETATRRTWMRRGELANFNEAKQVALSESPGLGLKPAKEIDNVYRLLTSNPTMRDPWVICVQTPAADELAGTDLEILGAIIREVESLPTDAERFAAALGGDGQRWETDDGESFEALAERMGARVEYMTRDYVDDPDTGEQVMRYSRCPRSAYRAGDPVRHVFPDGSVITARSGGWDCIGSEPVPVAIDNIFSPTTPDSSALNEADLAGFSSRRLGSSSAKPGTSE